MEMYEYTVKFRSEKNDTKKETIVRKLQETLGPYIVADTIEAESDAVQVRVVDVGETYPLYEG